MRVLIVLALVDLGLSSMITKEICFGSSYEFPPRFTPPLFKESIYYKPKGEERRLVFSNGQPKEERFIDQYGRIRMTSLTEQDDEGVLQFSRTSSVKLSIDDCQDVTSSYYGSLFSWRVPSGAKYMLFSKKISSGFAKPEVIWNRTDASVGWGRVIRNHFEIYNLKQKHSGYYKFMAIGMISWKRLEVQEFHRHFEEMEGGHIDLDFSVELPTLNRILFTPQESDEELLITRRYMDRRMELTSSYFSFRDLEYRDSGSYKFMDDDDFLAVHLELVVNTPMGIADAPIWVYVVALVVIILCILFCCCVKKCCCKKSSNKRNSPETEAAEPPVFYHDTTQPAQPLVHRLEREPRAPTTDPPMYNAAVGYMNPPTSTQVPEGLDSTPSIPACSDSDPKYEFKGMVFPSAPPLSSDTSIQDVYTSDKLNFL